MRRGARWLIVVVALSSAALASAGVPAEKLAALIRQLRAADWGERVAAAKQLGEYGDDARDAAPALVDALKDPRPDVRAAAAEALGGFKREAARVAPALAAALDDREQWVANAALSSLARLGPRARAAAPAVRRQLRAALPRDESHPGAIARAFLAIDQPAAKALIPETIANLKDADAVVRRNAADVLEAIGPSDPQPAVAALLKAVDDPDARVREGATVAARRLVDQTGDEFVPAVTALMSDQRARLRRAGALVARGYAERRQPPPAIVAAAIARADDPDRETRLAAIACLAGFGPAAKRAAPRLLAAAREEDQEIRQRASAALALVDPDNQQAAIIVHEWLTSDDEQQRLFAIAFLNNRVREGDRQALQEIIAGLRAKRPQDRALAADWLSAAGDLARPAVPALVEALRDADANVRRRAAESLGKINYDPVLCVPPLLAALQDENGRVRRAAATALGRFRTHRAAIAPALVEAAKDQDRVWLSTAADALAELGVRDPAMIEPLVRALSAVNLDERANAAEALAEMGPAAAAAAPALREVRRQNAPRAREQAQLALWASGAETADDAALEELFGDLLAASSSRNERAVRQLRRMGPGARRAIPRLLAILKAPREQGPARISATMLRHDAIVILGAIGLEPERVVPALLEALHGEPREQRPGLARALSKFGPAAKMAAPALLDVLPPPPAARGPGCAAFLTIAQAVLDIDPGNRAALAAVAQELRSPVTELRYDAVRFLAEQERLEPAVVPALTAALTDPEPAIRRLASFCLRGQAKPPRA